MTLQATRTFTEEAQSLEGAIDDQLALYRRLVKLVARQRDLVASDDATQLLPLLAERRRVTDELAELIRRSGPLQQRLQSAAAHLSDDARRRIEAKILELDSHLQAITAADQEDVRRLEIRKNQVGGQLKAIPARGAMLSAYGQGGGARQGALDRTDERP